MSTARVTEQFSTAHAPLCFLARIGMWGDSQSRLRRWAPYLILAQNGYGFVTQVINVVQTWDEFVLAAEYCVAMLNMCEIGIKAWILVLNSGSIQEILSTMDEIRGAHAPDDGTGSLQRRRSKADKIVRAVHTVSVYMLIAEVCIVGITCLFTRRILFRLWFPFDNKDSPMFELTLLTSFLLLILDYYVLFLFDLLVFTLFDELICEFKFLQHRLSRVDLADNPETTSSSVDPTTNSCTRGNIEVTNASKNLHFVAVAPASWTRSVPDRSWTPSWPAGRMRAATAQDVACQQRLAACVVHHLALIRLVSKVEVAIQPALVIHVVCNFCVGLTLALITFKSGELDFNTGIAIALVGSACVVEFALYCYFCTKITTESSRVGHAIYACPWWEASASFKRSMSIIQLRTNQPLVIRAAVIFPMSMKTFTKVMDTAYSMYNMMLTFN